jgi:6-phosphogluconolactonase
VEKDSLSVTIFEAEAWAEGAVRAIVDACSEAASEPGPIHIAWPGGSTPRAFYPRLADELGRRPELVLRTESWFGDERSVPVDHPESNAGSAQRMLLAPLGVAESRIHRMPADRADREVAALQHDREFPAALHLLIVGLGEDGHYASIFPGSPALREDRRRVVPATAPSGIASRMSITPRVVREARRVLVLAQGVRKAAAVAASLRPEGSVDQTPARALADARWILDREAASALSPRELR